MPPLEPPAPPPTPPPADSGRRIGIAAAIWAASIFLSRIIGLVREAVIGRILGGGSAADVYWTAFVVPDFLNYLLAGGALSIVFIPIFGGYLARDDEEGAWQAFSVIANALVLALGLITIGLWFALPWLVPVVAPGFDAKEAADLVALSRIILPAQIFHLVGGLLSAALQARDRHALPALAPLLYTGSIVVAGLLLGPSLGAWAFAWGVLAGSIVGPFGLPLIGCLRMGMRWTPVLRWNDDLEAYLWRSLPIMFGWSIVVVDDWILRREGSLLGPGAISTLQYAKTLMKVPMGVFGLATGVAAFPTLTRLLHQGHRDEAYRTLAGATRRMLVLAFAAQVGVTVAGTEIATVVYGPKLPASQHQAIGTALGVMSLGLWAWAAQTVVARGFYAMGNTWLPTIVGTVLVVVAYPVYVLGRIHGGTTGLAAASATAITTYVVVLMVLLRRQFPGVKDHYGGFFARTVPAVALGIAVGWVLSPWLPDLPAFEGSEHLGVYLIAVERAAALATTGLAVYVGTTLLLGVHEVHEVGRMLARRLFRGRGVP